MTANQTPPVCALQVSAIHKAFINSEMYLVVTGVMHSLLNSNIWCVTVENLPNNWEQKWHHHYQHHHIHNPHANLPVEVEGFLVPSSSAGRLLAPLEETWAGGGVAVTAGEGAEARWWQQAGCHSPVFYSTWINAGFSWGRSTLTWLLIPPEPAAGATVYYQTYIFSKVSCSGHLLFRLVKTITSKIC